MKVRGSDRIALKLLVLFCVALNIATLVLDAISTYEYAVIGFGGSFSRRVFMCFRPDPSSPR